MVQVCFGVHERPFHEIRFSDTYAPLFFSPLWFFVPDFVYTRIKKGGSYKNTGHLLLLTYCIHDFSFSDPFDNSGTIRELPFYLDDRESFLKMSLWEIFIQGICTQVCMSMYVQWCRSFFTKYECQCSASNGCRYEAVCKLRKSHLDDIQSSLRHHLRSARMILVMFGSNRLRAFSIGSVFPSNSSGNVSRGEQSNFCLGFPSFIETPMMYFQVYDYPKTGFFFLLFIKLLYSLFYYSLLKLTDNRHSRTPSFDIRIRS